MSIGKSTVSRPRLTSSFWHALLLGALLTHGAPWVWGDGTEMLGTPALTLATGTRTIGAGTGLFTQPGALTVDVPADATVKQVFLYWNGFDSSPTGTPGDSLLLNGSVAVTGDLIGGPTEFFPGGSSYTYRSDITALGLFTSGSNTLTIESAAFDQANNGASALIVIDEGDPDSLLQLRDGQDLAYINFPGVLSTTVPQVFSVAPLPQERTAELSLLAGSVDSPGVLRPNIVRVISGGVTTDFADVLQSVSGRQWDDVRIPLTIPAGADSLTVQILSEDCCATGNLPASLVWIGAGLTVFPLPGELSGVAFLDQDDDAARDAGEVGVDGLAIELRCAGSDGTLGTSDDFLAMTQTDSLGAYSFGGVPAGICELTLDSSSLPLGTEVGLCPVSVMVTVVQGGPSPAVDFCLRPDAPVGRIADRVWLPLPSSDGVVVLDPDGNVVGTLDVAGQEGPSAVAVGPAGVIWVLFRDTNAVARFTNVGDLVDVIPAGGDPRCIVVDSTGAAWISNLLQGTVTRISADGTVLLGPGGTRGGALATTGEPLALGVDVLDNLYVVTAQNLLEKRNAAGEVLAVVSVPEASAPTDLVVDRAGYIWLTLEALHQVERRASDLSLVETFSLPTGSLPRGLVVRGAAEAWVLGTGNGFVYRLLAGGAVADFFVGGTLSGITVDGRGQVWIGNETASAAVQLDPQGQVRQTIPLPGGPRFRGDASGVVQANVLAPGLDFDDDGFTNELEIDNTTNPFDELDEPTQQPDFVAPPESPNCAVQIDLVTVGWSLPPGSAYTSIEVRRNDAVVATLPGAAVEFQEPAPLVEGVYAYEVQGLTAQDSSPPALCTGVVGAGTVLGVVGLQVADLAVNIYDITTNRFAPPGEPVYYLTDPANGLVYGVDADFVVLIVIDSPLQGIAPTNGIAFNPDGNGGLGSLLLGGGPNGDPFQEATVIEVSLTGVPLGPRVILTIPGSTGGGGAPVFGNSIKGGLNTLSFKRNSETYLTSSTQNCELFSFRLPPPGGGGGPGAVAAEILSAASATHPLPGYALNGVYLPDYASFDEDGGRAWVTGPTADGGFELIEIHIANGMAEVIGDPVPLAGATHENSYGGFTLRSDSLSVVGLTTSSVYQLGSAFFARGDTDDSGLYDVGDAIRILSSLFEDFPFASCVDAYDFDDSGSIDIVDGVGLLAFMFGGGPAPVSPMLQQRAPDPTPDEIPCL